jgi:ubiquinone/menaquinone biosynthesis C-methylase UbiE
MFRDITAPYHILESWLYDRAVAPAVTEMILERPHLLAKVIDAMPAEGRLLDAGCGGGQLDVTLARHHPGWCITGLDLSLHQIHRALKRVRKLDGHVQITAASALAMPFRSGTFDGLISICSIKHWPEPEKGLEECLRVLRPGAPLAVLEVDPDYRRGDGRAFVSRQHVPFFLKPAAMAGFMWKIAARSISLKEAESLFSTMPVSDVRAVPVPGMPLWIISARKDWPHIPSKAGQI